MGKVELSASGISIDGKKEALLCASLFYFRLPRPLWERRIADLKASGYNCVDVYFPWNFHEREDGSFDFTADKDVDAFLKLCHRHGLYVIARPGPYICSEWDGGALPSRLCSKFDIRQNDNAYLAEVQRWFSAVLPVIARNEQGKEGSVILVQLENELDFFDCRDVEGMVSALVKMAKAENVSVPLFCCAGQGDAARAGGLTQGVVPTYNFYPAFSSRDFDVNCAAYNDSLKRKGLPLLVTETQREHRLLKRELLCGAKLLGAYNQVAGSNFEYFQSVNNWGKPLSIITTRYDFGSMITTLGDYNREADEGVALAQMLAAYGESLAAASSERAPLTISASYESPDFTGALALKDGGYVYGLINIGDADGTARVKTEGGDELEISVPAGQTLILPYKAVLDGITVEYSTYEIFSFDGKRLVLAGSGPKQAAFSAGGKSVELCGDGSVCGISVEFKSKAEAVGQYWAEQGLQPAYADDHCFVRARSAEVGAMRMDKPFLPADSLLLCDNGIFEGGLEAEIDSEGKPLLLEGVSDFMTVYGGSVPYGGLYGGETVVVPPSAQGKTRVRVEKWGHSNFNDPRRKSLYIKSARGIHGAFTIEKSEALSRWQFLPYEQWKPERLCYEKSEFDARLDPNSWNSASLPLIGLYYLPLTGDKGYDKTAVRIEGGEAEACLYLDGAFIGEFHIHDKYLDLTPYISGGAQTLELLVRKREWTQRTGDVRLLSLKKAEFKVRPFARREMLEADSADSQRETFPLRLKAGEVKVAYLDVKAPAGTDCYGVATGRGYKLTAVCGGRVIARMVAPDEQINQQGGSDTQFFIPSCYRKGKLKLVIEALADGELYMDFEYNKNLK